MYFRRLSEDGSVPFRVRLGVTGHRSLPDEEMLTEQIKKGLREHFLDFFSEASKETIRSAINTPISFTVVSPLAEGADRLVAKTILGLDSAPSPRIEAVLPMIKADYLLDFGTEQSKQEFEELLGLASRIIELRQESVYTRYSGDELRQQRRQAYEDAGRYVVDNCDLLIALWDRRPSRGKGGTAEIIDYAETKRRPVIIFNTEDPKDVRLTGVATLDAAEVEKIDRLNMPGISTSNLDNGVSRRYEKLFISDQADALPESAKARVKEILLPFQVKASEIAESCQGSYHRAGTRVYILSALAVLSVAVGTVFPEWSAHSYLVEFLLLLIALGVILTTNKFKAHINWLEYRFLAERLRSASILAVCGVEASLIELPSYIFTATPTAGWVEKAFVEIWSRLPPMEACHGATCEIWRDYALRHWIDKQITYHQDKAKEALQSNRLGHWAGLGVLSLALVAALAHSVPSLAGFATHLPWMDSTLTILAIALPGAGSAIAGIQSHREYSRISMRSSNMEHRLREIEERLNKVTEPTELERILKEAEELMMHEAQEWLMLMRFAELKHPH